MNTKQLDYLIEEVSLVASELEKVADRIEDTDAYVHACCALDMLHYLRAKLDVQLYGDYIPVELR